MKKRSKSYIKDNWQHIALGVAVALMFVRILELIESLIIKLALI